MDRLVKVMLATVVALGISALSAATGSAVAADTTPPTITITAPADGQHYAFGSAPNGSFSCADEAGGSGVATCASTTPISAAAGAHTFTVNATDGAGNPATKSVTYTIDPAPPDTTPPTITITSPVDGQHYAAGSSIQGSYSCADGDGSGVASCTSPTPLNATAGSHTFTVNATDNAANPATKSVTYIVDAAVDPPPPVDITPPTITITAPVDGQHYAFGSAINASFSCADEAGGSGVATCTNSTPVDASTGIHTFTVNATDAAGNPATKSITYTVDPVLDVTPPAITITSPIDAQHYAAGASIQASYSCADPGGSGVATCAATTAIDVSPGTHTFTVSATDNAGNPSTKSVTYTVDAAPADTTPPTITISSPVDGQHYGPGASIAPSYSCDDPGGSGVATCTSPTPIDFTAGTHTFTINATDNAGNAATKSVTYIVDAPPADTTPPTITITSPVDGQHYGPGATIAPSYSCDDGAGSGVATCSNPAVDTTAGAHSFTVSAADNAGNAATKSVTYVIDAAPTGDGGGTGTSTGTGTTGTNGTPLPSVARVTVPSSARSASLRLGVTFSLANLKPRSAVEVRVRRGLRTLAVFKTRAGSTGKAKLKIRLSRTQLRTLKGKRLTLRYSVTAASGKKRIATKTLKVT